MSLAIRSLIVAAALTGLLLIALRACIIAQRCESLGLLPYGTDACVDPVDLCSVDTGRYPLCLDR